MIEASSQALFVSAISAFEIAIKTRKGKLSLPLPALDWFAGVLDFHGIHELPLTSTIAIRSAELPKLHFDPCDRVIIASAEANGMRIVTSDVPIRQYAQARVVW